MRISVPAEIKNNEYRVAITPAGVKDLVNAGHDVVVQAGAGLGSGITDEQYSKQGATIVKDAAEVWGSAEMVRCPVSAETTGTRYRVPVATTSQSNLAIWALPRNLIPNCEVIPLQPPPDLTSPQYVNLTYVTI